MGDAPAASLSQQFAGKISQWRPLTLFQRDMGIDWLPNHSVDEITQPIRQGIEVGLVNLSNITGEDDLGTLSGPRNDCFDFVGREILGLINNEVDPLQASSPDIGQWGDEQFLRLPHFQDALGRG